MRFSELAKYLEKLEKTSSRIEITKILAELFNKSDKNEIDKTVYLLLGSLAPRYKAIVFNLAERMMLKVISEACGTNLEEVRKMFREKGDLGEVISGFAGTKKLKNLKTGKLSVIDVHDRLLIIAKDEGEGSQERKINQSAKLISELDTLSARFVVRIPVGKLRLGFSDKTILDALSWMKRGDKSAKNDLEKAYNVLPDIGLLAKNIKKFGIKKATENTKPVVGVPVLPMLAQRLKSPAEMIKKMEEVAVEPKFDGLRIQIHFKRSGFKDGEKVKAFTRNLNENSWMFPELIGIGKYIKAKKVILDTEAMGVDEQRKTLANFQTTMTRRRKHNIEKIASKIAIKFYVFDILVKGGKNLMDLPYTKRRKVLEKTIKTGGKILQIVDYAITKDTADIKSLMKKNLSEGLEGVIVKRANSRYVAGRTGWRWVKMKEKETSIAKLADTLDCVVMGYIVGKGRRTQFGIGGFLVGVRGGGKNLSTRGWIKTLTKIGTGLTDEEFREIKRRLSKLETKEKPKEYGKVEKILTPDVWVEPSLVVEIAADEITKSPNHSSGYALRFPRLVKFRDDKGVNQATTVDEVKKLFKLQ